jgi:hypothetical protein
MSLKGQHFEGIEIPDKKRVLSIGRPHNASVWDKHLKLIGKDPTLLDAGPLRNVLRRFEAYSNCLTRAHVFEIADTDAVCGIVAALVWGFPTGGYRGRYHRMAHAIGRANEYFGKIRELKASGTVGASHGLRALNSIGLGFAITSKMLYFLRVYFSEGCSLIYDSNVIAAIGLFHTDFSDTRAALGNSAHWYHRGTSSYSSFVREAGLLAEAKSVDADQVEAALFLSLAKAGWERR